MESSRECQGGSAQLKTGRVRVKAGMPTFKDMLASGAWWFSAVGLALAMNLLSAYLKPRTDSLFGKVSNQWRATAETRRQQWTAIASALANSPQKQLLASGFATRCRVRSIGYFLGAVCISENHLVLEALHNIFAIHEYPWWYVPVMRAFSLLVALYGMNEWWRANQIEFLIKRTHPELQKM